MVASFIGGVALASSLAFAGSPAGGTAASPAGDPPGVPTSTITTLGEKTAHYCVTDYAPNAAVAVHNEKTGDTASIRTNNRGRGCTDVPVVHDCGHLVVQAIVAAGVAADGNPGTSSAQASVPGNVAPCDPTDGSIAVSDGSSSVSGAAIAGIAGGGAGLAAVAAIVVIVVRRRRSEAAE